MKRRMLLLLAPGALLGAAPGFAHDHWLQPSSFHPAANERVDVRILVGHPSEYEERERDPTRIVRFEDVGPAGALPVAGFDARKPAGILRPRDAGLHHLVYQSTYAFVEIDAPAYAAFLEEAGLGDVQAERERRGETELPGRDSYARFDKALLLVRPAEPAAPDPALRALGAGFDRELGLAIELVLETDPFQWKANQELVLRLELANEPLPDRQVTLARLEPPFATLVARSDASGKARFTPATPGPWGAFSLHQRRTASEQGLEGDWEGLWASFTFELGAPAGEQPPARD